jgi:hypothetical protein
MPDKKCGEKMVVMRTIKRILLNGIRIKGEIIYLFFFIV